MLQVGATGTEKEEEEEGTRNKASVVDALQCLD
jgi:hypothetical protein